VLERIENAIGTATAEHAQLSTQAEELERLRGSLEMVRSRVLLADEQLMNNLIPNGWLAVSVAVHEAALALQPPTQQGEP
jgi:hypothetical protein